MRAAGITCAAWIASGCGSATVAFDDREPGIDRGSGPGAGAYQVVVEAKATTDPVLETHVAVEVLDDDGDPIDAEVSVNGTALASGVDGVLAADLDGYDEAYDITVDGPAGAFRAAAKGPEPHEIFADPGPWNRPDEVSISWSPHGAAFAAVEATGPGRIELRKDSGEYTFDPGTLELLAITVAVERWEELELTGGAKGSSFVVSYATNLHRTVTEPGGD
jgi:hypothetical protein